MNPEKQIAVTISTSTVVRAILLVLLVYLLYVLRDLVLVVFTAVVLASAIEPGARYFIRHKIPRIASVILVYILIFAILFGAFYLFLPILLDDASGLFAALPQYIDSLVETPSTTSSSVEGGESVGAGVTSYLSLQNIVEQLRVVVSDVSKGFVTTLSLVFGGILSFVLIIVLSFYFAVQETGVEDFLRVVTPIKHEAYVLDLWKRSREKIGLWMQGQLVLALVIGVLTYLGLTLFQVQYALLLAILAAVFEIIPVFGPVLAAVPAVIIALLQDTTLGILVLGFYIIIQQFENHLIYPLVVKKVTGVPPLLVIIALIVGAKLAGFLGIILAVPVAAIIQEFVRDIEKSRRKGVEKNPISG